MQVTFYGKLASTIGRQVELAVDTPCTILELRAQLRTTYPAAASSLADRRVRACVGDTLVADDHSLDPADEVDFLSPVSGG